jgi:predicted NUDIX family NTP pyrophosphohydrolase
MPEKSAGVLMYRRRKGAVELFLVHPGGPFWVNKDDGAWSIPKGLMEEGEEAEAAARREFEEETGVRCAGAMSDLGAFRQPSGKVIRAFACEGDLDAARIRSNEFELEWPPKSGKRVRFPEVDRAGWFDRETALVKILKGQRPIIDALLRQFRD